MHLRSVTQNGVSDKEITLDTVELKPKYTVQSLARAFTLLNAIADDAGRQGRTLTELAKLVGMSKGSVFSTLQTLKAYGMVSDHGTGHARRYRLGLGLIRLGNRAASQITVGDVARPYLESLSAETGLTSRIAIMNDNWAVAIAQVDAPGAVQVNLGLGEKEWPHRSAVGKSLLMGSTDEQIVAMLSHTEMPRNTVHTITTPAEFLADIGVSRERGYTVDDEEDRDGIICIAVPLRNAARETIAAISVTGLKAAPEMRHLPMVAEVLKKHSRDLSQALEARH